MQAIYLVDNSKKKWWWAGGEVRQGRENNCVNEQITTVGI